MSFERDIFISYAHLDNDFLTKEEEGWITQFASFLQKFLDMRMGSKIEIWRDNRLQGNSTFAREIEEQFPKTALLVSVLTPRYAKSDWCIREVNAFCESAEQTGGMVVDNKARIFKVIKTPVDEESSLPEVMRETLGYEFYAYVDEAPLELDPNEDGKEYKRKINKLAWDIAQLLKKLEASDDDRKIVDQVSGNTKSRIYLAECSYDQRKTREILEGDLKRHGYTVLPDSPLPREEADYLAAVEQLLARCTLAIHLVGEDYGAVPDGPSQRSVTVLQNELAVQRSKSSGLQRVIWLPVGTCSKKSEQQNFIEALHNDAEAQFGADLLTGDLEELKASIHSSLKKSENPDRKNPSEQDIPEEKTTLIYLICNEKDRKATIPVRKYCKDQGLDIEIPAFEGSATELEEANKKLLTTSNAVILFYGSGDETWKRTVDDELKKMKGDRGGKPLLACYTYLADPKTSHKEDLIEMEESDLINCLAGFSKVEMAGLIQAMSPKGANT